jgi:hypothetical protein
MPSTLRIFYALLWYGTLECDCTDSVDNWPWAAKLWQKQNWQLHGKETAEANYYFPTWYRQPPWDIVEFFNSQYKAIEHVLHLYGLGPMTMPKWLPFEYCHGRLYSARATSCGICQTRLMQRRICAQSQKLIGL